VPQTRRLACVVSSHPLLYPAYNQFGEPWTKATFLIDSDILMPGLPAGPTIFSRDHCIGFLNLSSEMVTVLESYERIRNPDTGAARLTRSAPIDPQESRVV
jgi:hypothetical protein